MQLERQASISYCIHFFKIILFVRNASRVKALQKLHLLSDAADASCILLIIKDNADLYETS